MADPLQDKYINLLTDFGFRRVFGTEPNKQLLIDFLNTILPEHHHVQDVAYKSNEDLGNTAVDHNAIVDIYCQGKTGEHFLVELQKAKQHFFPDRSVYYTTFPIQEQEWDEQLKAVYTIGILDFIFDTDQQDPNFLHTVQFTDQNGRLFHNHLKFIYIELPKFTKELSQLESHLDKWLFLLKHLSELSDRPEPLPKEVFNQLFETAEIANLSPMEQDSYQNSLKHYRDLNNMVNCL